MALGYSIGHWEGDTLVVDSVAFNDVTWLEGGGYFHSNNMEVIEKFTRAGNTLGYEVTGRTTWACSAESTRLNRSRPSS